MKLIARVGILLFAVAMTIISPFNIAPSASAAEQAAVGCYPNAAIFSNVDVFTSGSSYSGPYVTTSHCKDINVQFTSLPFNTRVAAVDCFSFNQIGTQKTISTINTWHVLAPNVADGTCYWLEFQSASGLGYQVSGYTAK